MKTAFLVLIVGALMLIGCHGRSGNQSADRNPGHGSALESSQRASEKGTSSSPGPKALGEGTARSGLPIENERGGDPNHSVLSSAMHQ